MTGSEPNHAPDGITVDGVDWLPSGARSGIVRVHGRRGPDAVADLPVLVLGDQRFSSLPDTAGAPADVWRGAFVVEAGLALSATDLWLEWPGGERHPLEPLAPVPEPDPPRLAIVEPDEPVPTVPEVPGAGPPSRDEPGGEVVERAVLAERRAGRAEAALDRQAAAARDALAAVEALELRAAALARDLESVRAERDTLRERVEPGDPSVPGPRETALERALAEREAEAQELRDALARSGEPVGVDEEAERRAAALTQALTESVGEVDALRAELHEQLVVRRTRDVAAGADRVALESLVREVETLRAAADAARAEAVALTAERDAARVEVEQRRAETDGANAAHDETRRRFTERVGELRVARERIAALEAELAAARRDADQVALAHETELESVREQATHDAQRAAERLAAAEARATRAEADAADVVRMRAEVERAETNLRRAETAREVAVASALAANAQRRAAAVRDAEVDPGRVAALEGELVSLRAQLAAAEAPPPATTPPVTAPTDLIARAAEQVRAATAHRSEPEVGARMMANLDAAAAALRAATPPPPAEPAPTAAAPAPADEPPAPATPADEPPVAAAPIDEPPTLTDEARASTGEAATPAPAEEAPVRRQITAEFAQLPGELARGRGGRAYPPLRGALVRFAHDDPVAAARLIEGLAPALAKVVPDAPPLDVTLEELDTTLAIDSTQTRRVDEPRGRRESKLHLSADAVTLAETLAGVGPPPKRRGPLKALRGARRARAVAQAIADSRASLPQLVLAGARLDPALALRTFAYAVPGAWTRGHAFTVNLTVDGVSTGIHVADGAGIAVGPPASNPDITVALDRAKFDALLTGADCAELHDPPLAILREWAVRLGALATLSR